MNANDILSGVRERVEYMLTERLRNFSNEARLAIEAIEKEKGIKINERDKLWIILKSLKDMPRKMAVELIRNSSLDNDDRAFLNIVCGDPEVYVLSPTTGNKILVPDELKQWPRKDATDED